MTSAADWAELLEPVARRLLADRPCREHNGDLRYGMHGSLVVHLTGPRRGTWRDFEADAGGGVLALVEHLLQTDKPGALRWLADERLIEPDGAGYRAEATVIATDGAHNGPVGDFHGRPGAPVSATNGNATPRPPAPTAHVAAAILAAAVSADATPARVYLARRWTWPPDEIGSDLPAAVRWCAARDVPSEAHLPSTAAGAVVYVLRRPDVLDDPTPAVSMEAVTTAGELVTPRWRRSFGEKTGRVFEVPINADGAVVLVEGERDALAVAMTIHAGVVRSVGGTAGYRDQAAADLCARPVILMPDAEHTGVAAVTRLLLPGALPSRVVRVVRAADGDPADWLAAWLTERAGIREYDGSADRRAATAAAWRDLLAAVQRGDTILIDLETDR